MDIARIITVYVLQLGLGIVFLIIGLIVIKRDKKRLNQIFSMFFFTFFIGTLLNVIYAPLTINPAVYILHVLTVIFMNIAGVILLVFNIILLQSEKKFNTQKQVFVVALYILLHSFAFLIPGAIKIDASTNWKPVWSLPFVTYFLILNTIYIIIPNLYFFKKIYNKFEDDVLKKRWQFFGLGMSMYYVFSILLPISNFINDTTFRGILSIIGLLMLPTALLLYYGVGRQVSK